MVRGPSCPCLLQVNLLSHPQPGPTHPQIASDVAEYAVAYTTKIEGIDLSAIHLESIEQLISAEAARTTKPNAQPAPSETQAVGKWRLAHATNAAHGALTLPLTLATYCLLAGGQSFESHKYTFHDVRLFQRLLLPARLRHSIGATTVTPQFAIRHQRRPPPATLEPHWDPAAGEQDAEQRALGDAMDALMEEGSQALSDATISDAEDDQHHNPSTDGPHDLPEEWSGIHLQALDYTTDYLLRGPDLAPFSSAMVSMWFHKRAMGYTELGKLEAGASIPGYRLDPRHPQYSTHRWELHTEPRLLQTISEPPPEPCAEAPSDDLEVYAAWVLGNFGVYSLDPKGNITLEGPLWPHFQNLKSSPATTPAIRIAQHYVANAQSRAITRLRGDARRAALDAGAQVPTAGTNAGLATAMPDLLGRPDLLAQDPQEGAHDSDDQAQVEVDHLAATQAMLEQDGLDLPDPQPPSLAQHALTPEQLANAALATFNAAPSPDDPFAAHALHLMPPSNLPTAELDPLGNGAAPAPLLSPVGVHALQYNVSEATLDMVRTQTKARATFSIGAQADTAALDAAQHGAQEDGSQRLRLYHDDEGIPGLVLSTSGVGGQGPALKHLGRTDLPPFVLLPSDQRPTPEDTATLFNLNTKQRSAFLLLAYTLLADLVGKPPQPLTMFLTGDAGCGKTRVVVAFMWYAFQLRATYMICASAYMWRAAMNVSHMNCHCTSNSSS